MANKKTAVSVDNMRAMFEPREVPTEWHERFTEQDKADVATVVNWLNKHGRTGGFIGNACSMNRNTCNQLLSGKYPGVITANVKKMLQAIASMDARREEKNYTPFVSTSVSRLIDTACHHARISGMISVVAANVGTGKTRGLKEYTNRHANTWFIEAQPGHNWGCMVDGIIDALRIKQFAAYVPVHKKFAVVIDHVKHIEDGLLIVDEAETVNPKTLHGIRRFCDLGGIGVVLAGTSQLYSLIRPEGGQFDQIRSRAPFFPEPIYQITKDDARAVIATSFDDRPEVFNEDGDLNEDIFDALWSLCDGSMRMLVAGLIPNIRRYGIAQYNVVSAEVIYAVAKKALNLSPNTKRK